MEFNGNFKILKAIPVGEGFLVELNDHQLLKKKLLCVDPMN
jgi:hypothetical protein